MALNEIQPACLSARAGRKRVRIDWKRGATLLIDGETPTAICAALGIDEDRLWRHLRNSLRFQHLLRQARERRQLLGQLKLESASREAVVRLARSADRPEASLIAQLALTAQGKDLAEGDGITETSDVIARLAESGRRAPNQAFRKRLASDRRQMDAEFEAYCRADAARLAAQAAAQTADAATRTENKTRISENKHDVSAETPVQLERHPHPQAEEGGARIRERVRATPDAVPFGMLPGLQNGGIVDLTDGSGAPIAGMQTKWDPGSR